MVVRLFKEQPDSNIQLSSIYALQLIIIEVHAKQVLSIKVVQGINESYIILLNLRTHISLWPNRSWPKRLTTGIPKNNDITT